MNSGVDVDVTSDVYFHFRIHGNGGAGWNSGILFLSFLPADRTFEAVQELQRARNGAGAFGALGEDLKVRDFPSDSFTVGSEEVNRPVSVTVD